MRIESLQIENYKGFSRSEPVEFGIGFNVLVGQNNSGKSAILECLRLGRADHKPHRSDSIPADQPVQPHAEFLIRVSLTGKEIRSAILAGNQTVHWPVNPLESARDRQRIKELLSSDDQVVFEFVATSQNSVLRSAKYPSHGLFKVRESKTAVGLSISSNRRGVDIGNATATDLDSIFSVMSQYISDRIYIFDAQRFNVGRMEYGDDGHLLSNASNLPRVLLKMQPNRARFERFNRHVSEIFPNIEWVSVNAAGKDIEIRVLAKGVDQERQDLAVPLHESGSGIGQVLAIIYVAMTMRGAVVGIDEPNSFLHPGAAKKLLEILKYYGDNQYILSTHSSGLLSASNPSKIIRVFWEKGQSKIENIDGAKLDGIRAVLSEIGASLSDVFGPEGIIWVEGETEEDCFPVIYREFFGSVPSGTCFLVMRSTGEVESNNAKANATLDIYQRLSAMGQVIAPTVAFSFDRELRDDIHVQDLERRSIPTRVLKRRTFENYLIDAEAISFVLSSELSIEISKEDINVWIQKNLKRFRPRSRDYAALDDISVIDAPRMLKELFGEVSQQKLEYRKRVHSVAICRWLLRERKDALSEVAEYIRALMPVGP